MQNNMKKNTKIAMLIAAAAVIAGLCASAYIMERQTAPDAQGQISPKSAADAASDINGAGTSATRGSAKQNAVINILIVGDDTFRLEDMDSNGNADGEMLVSINSDTKELIFTTFLRYIEVKDAGGNSARLAKIYRAGGIDALINAFEDNFEIDIDHYVCLNFVQAVTLLEKIGSISVHLSPDEIAAMTRKIDNINSLIGAQTGDNMLPSDAAGTYELNAVQTLAYMRIRPSDDNTDFARASRSQVVLAALLEKVKSMNVAQLASLAGAVSENVDTDISVADMIGLAAEFKELSGYEKFTDIIPIEGTYSFTDSDRHYIETSLPENVEHLRNSIYEGIH